DDTDDKGDGLNTQHADSYVRATLPSSGTWYVILADAQHQGGPEYGYRLRLTQPRPDFELRVTPASLNVRGPTVPLTVYALRKDGFSNDIAITLRDAPPGFTLSGARIPANEDHVRLTLSVISRGSLDPMDIRLQGRATIGGQEIVRPCVPAEDMMQAFAYHHLVPAHEMKLAVAGRWGPAALIKIATHDPVKIPIG